MSTAEKQIEHRLVWSDPIEELARKHRERAATLRDIMGDGAEARMLEKSAEEIEAALRDATAPAWLPINDAAHQLQCDPATLRARCRRRLQGEGLAKKQGADWLVHASVIRREAIA